MLIAVAVADGLVTGLEWSLLLVGGLVVLRCLLVLGVALAHGRRQRRRRAARGLPAGGTAFTPVPSVTVVVPAYNERECIASTVHSLLASTCPVEVIVVDDGSTDGTADVVEAIGAPGVRVLRQPNSGKPAALNAGIAAASHEIVVLMDGDTIFEPRTVAALIEPFDDPAVGAVAGNARVADRDRLLARLQHIEYVIGFNIDRRVQDMWGVITTVPGAIGAFRTQALRTVGGISPDTLAEDTDLRSLWDAPDGGSSTNPPRGRGPKPRPPWGNCGDNGTDGATGSCSRCGSTDAPCSIAVTRGTWDGSGSVSPRCSRSCCPCSRRSSTST